MEQKNPLSLFESVRKRPGMYLGDVTAYDNVVYEIIANSIDQFLAGHATQVSIKIENDSATVSDDGIGLPFLEKSPTDKQMNRVEHFFVHRHDAPTADGHAPHIHVLSGGLGLAVVNCASETIQVESSNGTQKYRQSFGKGEIRSPAIIENSPGRSGTTIRVKLNKEIFKACQPNLAAMRKTLFELAHFYPGFLIEFQEERFKSNRGLLDLALIKLPKPSTFQRSPTSTFNFSQLIDGVHLQACAVGEDEETEVFSWVNGTETIQGGDHVEGFRKALQNSNWKPRLALIHVVMHDPGYAGPVKEKLVNTEIEDLVETTLTQYLGQFLKTRQGS